MFRLVIVEEAQPDPPARYHRDAGTYGTVGNIDSQGQRQLSGIGLP